MDGAKSSDPVRLVIGAAATAGAGLRGAIGFGLDVARRVPGVDPVLATLEDRGTETLHTADELADRVLHAVLRKVVQVGLLEVDITAIVRDHVDLDVVAEGIDLIDLADTVIEGVDLPRIIRESTGSMSSEAVLGVRSQGMQADDAVSGFVGKLFGRSQEQSVERGEG
ncbi:hypothetical protein [Rhodococcus marinonascens]|uniref:hypothetical protein n=1 Tax=Rhodococcus marinonascens TaxID=38311 RepID=UPI000932D98E|nr:hypothetical protein [Rhodococcus marinonascens]